MRSTYAVRPQTSTSRRASWEPLRIEDEDGVARRDVRAAAVGRHDDLARCVRNGDRPPDCVRHSVDDGERLLRLSRHVDARAVRRHGEARGLDATPLIQRKLTKAGDACAVEILDVILRDEVGHVAIGNHWYRWLCQREGLDPVAHYGQLVQRYGAPRLKPPFNRAARLSAGFTEAEIAFLEGEQILGDAPRA